MQSTTKGLDTFNNLFTVLNEFNCVHKLSAVCTNGAPAMIGKNHRLVSHLKSNQINVSHLPCIFHQEKIVNMVRDRQSSTTTKYTSILTNLELSYGVLKLNNSVRV